MTRKESAYAFIRRKTDKDTGRIFPQVVKTSGKDKPTYNYSDSDEYSLEETLDNHAARVNTRRMVRKSKQSNRELKRGNFGKAELLRRKSEKFKNRALDRAKYNREKLIDIHLKSNDGEVIRHDSKLKSIDRIK